MVVASFPRRGKEGWDLVEGRIGRGCIARRGEIGLGRDTASIEGHQKRMMMRGTDGHCDVRGSQGSLNP